MTDEFNPDKVSRMDYPYWIRVDSLTKFILLSLFIVCFKQISWFVINFVTMRVLKYWNVGRLLFGIMSIELRGSFKVFG